MSRSALDFQKRYAAAFERYRREPGEVRLRDAYELGRDAVRRDLTVLELVEAHHDVLLEAVQAGSPAATAAVRAARDFFLESISAYEMVRRGFAEAHEAAVVERQHALILRRLSSFLSDTSAELHSKESLAEMLQLVVEQARELIEARCCVGWLARDGDDHSISAYSYPDTDPAWRSFIEGANFAALGPSMRAETSSLRFSRTQLLRDPAWCAAVPDSNKQLPERGAIAAHLTGWDNRALGTIYLFDKESRDFSEVDEAIALHLAQLTSAAIERARLFISASQPQA